MAPLQRRVIPAARPEEIELESPGNENRHSENAENGDESLDRLGWFTVVCIIAQRMIGTGIFSAPTYVLMLDHNVGASLLLWALGALISLASTHILLEYISVLPKFDWNPRGRNEKIHLPMNGSELIFLNHLFPKPGHLVTSIFGMIFVILGNSAPNCISFGYHFLQLCGAEPERWAVAGVAIAASISVCFMHATWRRWGIRINNTFAIIKVAILLLIVFLAIAALFPSSGFLNSVENLKSDTSFKHITNSDASGLNFSTALLSIMFTFGGWNQANYIFGEVGMSPKQFRITSLLTVFGLSILYVLTNIAYMIVVPLSRTETWSDFTHLNPDYVIISFFDNTLGMTGTSVNIHKLVNFFQAFSSLGNIVVTTFTAARVKQEVAKEGAMLYKKSINIVKAWDLGDWIYERWTERRERRHKPARRGSRQIQSSNAYQNVAEYPAMASAPSPALILHCIFSVLLILLSTLTDPSTAYTVLLGVYSYLIDVSIPLILTVMLLYHMARKTSWLRRTHRGITFLCAALVIPADLYIISLLWAPHTTGDAAPFWLIPALAVVVILMGAMYWLILYIYRETVKSNEYFDIQREPQIMRLKSERYMVIRERLQLNWIPNFGDQEGVSPD